MKRNTLQAAAGCALALWVAGCIQPVNRSEQVLRDVSQATLLEGAIEWHTEGQPIDVPTPNTSALSEADAIRLAVRNSPSVQMALWKVRAAEADANQARLLPNPILAFTYRWTEAGGPAAIEVGLAADLMAVLTMSGKIQSQDARLRSAADEALKTVLDVIAEAAERYVTAVTADETLEVLADREHILQKLLDVARARLKAGDGTQLDVTTLEAQRLTLEGEVEDQQLARRDERLRLARLIGTPGGNMEWKLESWAAPKATKAPESEWIKTALEHRPDVLSARWEAAGLAAEAKLAAPGIFQGLEAGVASQKDPVWEVGPTITTPIPIFDLGQMRHNKAIADYIGARHKLVDAQRAAVEDVRRSLAAFNASERAVIRTRGELLPIVQRRRDQAEKAYRAGETDLATLLLAEEELADTRAKLTQLRLKCSVARIRLERSIGGSGREP